MFVFHRKIAFKFVTFHVCCMLKNIYRSDSCPNDFNDYNKFFKAIESMYVYKYYLVSYKHYLRHYLPSVLQFKTNGEISPYLTCRESCPLG